MGSKIKDLILKFSGVIDVASVSAANFIISLFILRELTDTHYAIYVNLFSVLMLLSTLQNAFFNTALSVHSSKIKDNDEKRSQSLHICLLANIAYVCLLLPSMFFSFNYPLWLVLCVYCSHALYLNRELYRTYNFVFGQKGRVVLSATISIVILSTALMLGITFNFQSLVFVYASLAVASLASGIILFSGVSFQKIKKLNLKKAKDLIVSFAKWTSLGSLATWGQNNSYTYLATAIIGLEATAALAAARLITMPINVVASGIYMAEKPKWAALYTNSKIELKRMSRIVSLSMFTFVLLFALISFLMLDFFSSVLTTTIDPTLLALWFIATGIQCFKFANSNVLNVSENFQYLALMGVKVAIFGVITSSILGVYFGAVGILIGFCLGELIHLYNTNKRIVTGKVLYEN